MIELAVAVLAGGIALSGLMVIILTSVALYALNTAQKLATSLDESNKRSIVSLEANNNSAWNALLSKDANEKVEADGKAKQIQLEFDQYVDAVHESHNQAGPTRPDPLLVQTVDGKEININDGKWELLG